MLEYTFLLIILLISLLIYYLNYLNNYWRRHNFDHIPGKILVGNLSDAISFKKSSVEVFDGLYNAPEAINKPYIGINLFYNSAILLRDLELIKKILITDSASFIDRFADSSRHSDPIGGYNLFVVKNPLWKILRAKLTPFFSSGKIKQMIYLGNEIGSQLNEYLLDRVPENDEGLILECKNLATRYTIDVIATCAFGVRANSIKGVNVEFLVCNQEMFTFSILRSIEFSSIFLMPAFARLFRCKFLSKKGQTFIKDTLRFIISERKKSGMKRNDLIDTLIEWQDLKEEGKIKLTEDMWLAQAAAFFSAGTETGSTEIAFALYEISKNPDVQTRLRNEIKEVLIKTDSKPSYEDINEMEYLNMVVQETLRLYPSLPFLDRKCVNPNGYALESDNKFVIPKEMPMMIPIFSIQRDPKYFEDPLEFNPERFSPENKHKIKSCSFMPFGAGVRNCIGERFGRLQVKIGLISILSNHKLEWPETQSRTMRFEPKALVLQSADGLNVRFKRDILYKTNIF